MSLDGGGLIIDHSLYVHLLGLTVYCQFLLSSMGDLEGRRGRIQFFYTRFSKKIKVGRIYWSPLA